MNAENSIPVGTYVLYRTQESAPLLREREAFLEHLLQQGTSLAAARGVSWQLLNVIRLLKLTRLRGVRINEIEDAAKGGHDNSAQIRTFDLTSTRQATSGYVARKWLHFAGVLKRPAILRMRFADATDEFARWMTEEMGLSMPTVRSRRQKTSLFLKWLSERHRSLAAVRLRNVDDFLIKGTNGWSRKSHVATPTRFGPSSVTRQNVVHISWVR